MNELIELIKAGDGQRIEEMLIKDPSLAEGTTEQGISLLQFAAYCRNIAVVDIIKKYKNNLNIFEAASIGDAMVVNDVIEKHPETIKSFSADGFTVLGLATFFGHLVLVKLLLDKGSSPNIAANNQFHVTPLHSACAISNVEIAELLIKNGADVNAKQMQGVTPLHSAAHNGQTLLTKLLIDNGADINAKMDNGQTPLYMAEEKDFKETAELIRNCGGH